MISKTLFSVILIFNNFLCHSQNTKDKFIGNELNPQVKVSYKDSCLSKMESISNEIKNGISILFYPTSNVASIAAYSNNILIGEYIEYHKNGTLKIRGSFVSDSIKDITYKEKICFKSSDGINEIICMNTFYKGEKIGEWKFYYDNGKLQYKGTYKKGKREGNWIYYDLSGNIEKIEMWEEGKYIENKLIPVSRQ